MKESPKLNTAALQKGLPSGGNFLAGGNFLGNTPLPAENFQITPFACNHLSIIFFPPFPHTFQFFLCKQIGHALDLSLALQSPGTPLCKQIELDLIYLYLPFF
ncbi:hypothetical protein K737_300140 [Holospora undulata HU1]|uniref:Uncharacterized protein n=1 Tax=Holospora undulata HU1 TaxID=1321371 RepID=A0A061JGY5_9PROT|nr:hypothetical protein K737_300140 [Holospora undulata HU1]